MGDSHAVASLKKVYTRDNFERFSLDIPTYAHEVACRLSIML